MVTNTDVEVPRYPDVKVQVFVGDGVFYPTAWMVRKALEKAGASFSDICDYITDSAVSGPDHLLETVMRWVSAEVKPVGDAREFTRVLREAGVPDEEISGYLNQD